MNPKLKKGQFVAFLTNQPAAHLNEMFGYNDLGPHGRVERGSFTLTLSQNRA